MIEAIDPAVTLNWWDPLGILPQNNRDDRTRGDAWRGWRVSWWGSGFWAPVWRPGGWQAVNSRPSTPGRRFRRGRRGSDAARWVTEVPRPGPCPSNVGVSRQPGVMLGPIPTPMPQRGEAWAGRTGCRWCCWSWWVP